MVNEGEYEKYLRFWKVPLGEGEFRFNSLRERRSQGWCGLCEALNGVRAGDGKRYLVENVNWWWNGLGEDKRCH